MKNKEENLESIMGGKRQKHEVDIYSHRESGLCTRQKFGQPRYMKSKIEEVGD
jgi:hypothetical protein